MATRKKDQLKYRKIYEHIRDGIVAGKYDEGDKIPTQMELASQFGVSRLTVIHALNELEHDGILLRRQGSGCYVGKKRQTATGQMGLIAINAPGIISEIADVIVQVIQQKGFDLLWRTKLPKGTGNIARHTEEQRTLFKTLGVTGMFYMPLLGVPNYFEYNNRIIESFIHAGIHVVLLDREMCEYPHHSPFDFVGIDNFGAGYDLCKHLLDLGYTSIEIVSNHLFAPMLPARIEGYKTAFHEKGIEPPSEFVHVLDTENLDEVKELMNKTRPQAFLCVNDLVAGEIMPKLDILNIKVPNDMAVVGIDDMTWPRHLHTSPITTIAHPYLLMGTVAGQMMLDRFENPELPFRYVTIRGKMVVRESCGIKLKTHSKIAQ